MFIKAADGIKALIKSRRVNILILLYFNYSGNSFKGFLPLPQ